MTTDEARVGIIKSSLALTLGLAVFFFTAPSLGYPLNHGAALRLLATVIPVFSGYLGSAVHYIFRPSLRAVRLREGSGQLLALLTYGPIAIFCVSTVALLFSFAYGNRHGVQIGSGNAMSVETLSLGISLCLGFLAITTSAIVSYLFSVDLKGEDSEREARHYE